MKAAGLAAAMIVGMPTRAQPAGGEGTSAGESVERRFGWQDMYARHIGHADLLRERIDGRVGL
jgi:hypothetical protein